MKINMAHLRERSTTGGWIDFAVFEAKSISGTDIDNKKLLNSLVLKARLNKLKVDQAALAFEQHGQIQFFGDKNLVGYLSKSGVPEWTHTLDA